MTDALKENIPHNLEDAQKKIRDLEEWAAQLERAKEDLAKSESEHRTAFEHSGTGMLLIRDDMMVLMANQRIEEIIGYPNSEVKLKHKWTDFVVPEDLERLKTYHFSRRKSPDSAPSEYEFRIIDNKGKIRDVFASVTMIPGTTQSLVSMMDITSRKAVEKSLGESERRFKETVELLPGIICEMDAGFNLTYVNEMGLKTLGLTREEFRQGINANDFIHPDDRPRVASDVFNITHGDYGNPQSYRLRAKNGTNVRCLINAAPMMKNGAVVGIRCCIIDVSDRFAAEERFRTIFQKSPIGIALYDRSGGLIEMNESYAALASAHGRTTDANLFGFFELNADEKALLDKGGSLERETQETAAMLWREWHVTPLGAADGAPSSFLVQVEDVTEKKRAQEVRLRSQREATEKAEALVAGLRRELLDKSKFHDMVSRSPQMREIFELLPEVAAAAAPVLISGESGTGKELVARSLHELSPRAQAPFVAINCAALPDTLLESELFGYKAGAFTDAKKDKPGKFALAAGGTIFFDEIGDVSPAMQVKLLRVLQEKKYEPLGGTVSAAADARVMAATNRDLQDMVRKGAFREDLFYRINVVAIRLPPLRERRSDIPLLCDHFIERFNGRYGKEIKGISQEAMQNILAHEFPGNIRELENTIEHAFVFCKSGMIGAQHLPANLRGVPSAGGSGDPFASISGFDELERLYINVVLKEVGGNRLRAAERLGVHKATLFRKMRKLGIQ